MTEEETGSERVRYLSKATRLGRGRVSKCQIFYWAPDPRSRPRSWVMLYPFHRWKTEAERR